MDFIPRMIPIRQSSSNVEAALVAISWIHDTMQISIREKHYYPSFNRSMQVMNCFVLRQFWCQAVHSTMNEDAANSMATMTSCLNVQIETPILESLAQSTFASFYWIFINSGKQKDSRKASQHGSILLWKHHLEPPLDACTCYPDSILAYKLATKVLYCKVSNFDLTSFAPVNIISKGKVDITKLREPANQSVVE